MLERKTEVIQLSDPVEVDGKTYTTIILNEFRAKHFKYLPPELFELVELQKENMNKGEEGEDVDGKNVPLPLVMKLSSKFIPLIASMADVDEKVIGEFAIKDLLEVVNRLSPLLAASM